MNPSNSSNPETKSPVRLTLCILGVVIALCVALSAAYSARESLLVGVIKFGFHVDSPMIVNHALKGVLLIGGNDMMQELIQGDDENIALATDIYLREGEVRFRRVILSDIDIRQETELTTSSSEVQQENGDGEANILMFFPDSYESPQHTHP